MDESLNNAYYGRVSFFHAVYLLVRSFFPKMTFHSNGVRIEEPAIFVANHADAFGPIALHLYFPIRLYPWVIHEMTDRRTCARYLEKDFIIKELRLPKPFSAWLSFLMADICVALFRYLEAIPVYHDSRRIMETISTSIVYLEEGRSLLIFPEISDSYLSRYIKRFNIGFLEVAKKIVRIERRSINIYPVSVDRGRRRISLGEPSAYEIAKNYPDEKKRIEAELEAKVEALLDGKA